MAKFCTRCGTSLEEDAIYCSSCGFKVNSVSQVLEEKPYQNSEMADNLNTGQAMKPKSSKAVLFILVILVLIGAIYYYNSNKSTPEKTIAKFESSYNNLDADGMLVCFEPSVQKVYKGTTALLSGFTGYDVNSIISGVLGLYDLSDDESQPQINLNVVNVEYTSSTEADVSVECSYCNGEDNESSSEDIPMVKIDGKWYIEGDFN